MIELDEMNNTLIKIYALHGEYYPIPTSRNNTSDLTSNRSLFKY